MSNRSIKGMILAAGFGTRMQPLTDYTAKPLLPVLGKPIVRYQASLLKKAGIDKAVVNLHHFGKLVQDYVASEGLCGLDIDFSWERDEILGTGGGVLHAEKHLSGSTVVLVNGDTLLDFDLSKVVARHFETGAAVTMLLKKSDIPPDENSIYLNDSDMVKRLVGHGAPAMGLTKCAFLGVHVFEPEVFGYLPRNGCIIRKAYTRMVDDGLFVSGMICDADYRDIGTPTALLDANMEMLAGDSYTGPGCRIEHGATIGGGAVLTGGNAVRAGAVVENSLVLKDETIEGDEKLFRTIAGFGLRLEV